MLREPTSLSLNSNFNTLILSSLSEVDLVTGGPAYMLSPSLPLGSPIQTMGEPIVTDEGVLASMQMCSDKWLGPDGPQEQPLSTPRVAMEFATLLEVHDHYVLDK